MKKLLVALLALLLLAGCSSAPSQKTDEELMAEGWVKNPTENGYVQVKELPETIDTTKTYKPSQDAEEVACEAGVYSASCSSINASNLYEYLNIEGVLYIDLRDYNDYGQKHLRNFEVIPYFAYIFDAEAGTNPDKPQLYGGSVSEPVAAYNESDELLEVLFPKDTVIFLMCQSGGRVANFMKLLEAKGYDMSLIYNVGGMGQYTDAAYAPLTVDALEARVDATYSFEGLTR